MFKSARIPEAVVEILESEYAPTVTPRRRPEGAVLVRIPATEDAAGRQIRPDRWAVYSNTGEGNPIIFDTEARARTEYYGRVLAIWEEIAESSYEQERERELNRYLWAA